MECDALKHDTGEGSGPISLEPFGYYLEVILRVLFGGHSEELSGDPVHLDIGVWGPFGPLKGVVFCANRLLLGTGSGRVEIGLGGVKNNSRNPCDSRITFSEIGDYWGPFGRSFWGSKGVVLGPGRGRRVGSGPGTLI